MSVITVKMKQTKPGSTNGRDVSLFLKDHVYPMPEHLANVFLDNGIAEKIEAAPVPPAPEAKAVGAAPDNKGISGAPDNKSEDAKDESEKDKGKSLMDKAKDTLRGGGKK